MVELDLKDRKILYQLDLDARQSFSQIGRKVNLPKTVVAYRVKKMINQGIIKKFYTVIDTFKLGYECFRIYLNYQYTNPTIENNICNYFKKNPLNWWTISAEGRYDLAVILWVNNINKFYGFWEKTLQKYRDYFRNQQFSVYIQSFSFINEFLLEGNQLIEHNRQSFILSGERQTAHIDDIDLQIIKLISNNARLSLREIAIHLDYSYSIIKNHFDNLIKIGIIQGFRADIDIFTLGYQYYKADINLKKYTDRTKILNYISKNPHLIRIDKSIGVSDLELEFHVKDHNEFHAIMEDLNYHFHDSIRNYKYLSASKIHNMNYIPLNL